MFRALRPGHGFPSAVVGPAPSARRQKPRNPADVATCGVHREGSGERVRVAGQADVRIAAGGPCEIRHRHSQPVDFSAVFHASGEWSSCGKPTSDAEGQPDIRCPTATGRGAGPSA
jgi:hypothetical protein